MSQNDPKSPQVQSNATAGKPPTSHPPQKPGDKKPRGSRGSNRFWYVLLFLVAAALVVAYGLRQGEEPPPVVSAAQEDALGNEAEPGVEAEGSSSTAALVIHSNVRGADVYLNGHRVGKTPHKATPLTPGDYEIRVSHQGYEAFEERVRVESEDDSIHADLRPIEVESSAREGKGSVGSPADVRNNTAVVAVKHKHRFGSCEGVLRAGGDGVRYETDHKDAFVAAYSNIEEFRLDGDELVIKVRDGRKYDFAERNDDEDALAAFHAHVGEAAAKAESAN